MRKATSVAGGTHGWSAIAATSGAAPSRAGPDLGGGRSGSPRVVAPATIERFRGEIWGIGTTSGHRMVVGRWIESPFGSFADVMHEAPDGTRTLLAPTDDVAAYVEATYRFDRVVVVEVAVERSAGRLQLDAGPLSMTVATGPRTALGRLLRLVPAPLARARWWCAAVDPVARLLLHGVRTRGTAGNGRREWYGASDQHRLVQVRATWDGTDLGDLAPVEPPVRFGFSSTPRTPGVVEVTTSVQREAEPTGPGGRPRPG